MAAPMRNFACRNGAIFSPAGIAVRHRNKVYVQKPRPRILQRRILEDISKPILLPRHRHPAEECGVLYQTKKQKEENLYTKFLVKQCKKVFDENAMFVVMQKLSMSGVDIFNIKVQLAQKGIKYHYFDNYVFLEAIKGTKWEVLQNLFVGENLYAACPEDKVKDLVRIMKKFQNTIILGGVVENRALTRDALLRHAQLPPLDHLRGQLVSILSAGAAKTSSLLSSQQQTLANNLEQLVKQNQESEGK